MCALDHPKMNTSAQKYIAPQLHMHHCAEGNTKPFTGPKAFAAMKQDEARKAMNHNTPSNKARQPGRHIKQPDTQREDQHRTGPGRHKGPTEGEGKGQGEDNGKTQAEPQHNNTIQRSHSTKGTNAKTKGNPRARKARPQKQTRSGVQEGDRTTKDEQKGPPKRKSKTEQIMKRCQRAIGTEDPTGAKRTRQEKKF